jgi:hypothetical protein
MKFVVYYRVFTRVFGSGRTRVRKQLCVEETTKSKLLTRQAEMSARGIDIVVVGEYPTLRRALDKYETLSRVRAEREGAGKPT